jgi:site-specific DNA-adenine methylase
LIPRPLFSFYGAKWRASKYYPEPKYNTIVEPFAGSACYSLRYNDKKIILNDIDPTIYELWKWLINVSENIVLNLPIEEEEIKKMHKSDPALSLIGFWHNKGQVKPTLTRCNWMSTEWADQFWGEKVRARVSKNLQFIRDWSVSNKDYKDLDNIEATWFIDPPYSNKGKHYIFSKIDFEHLGEWCKTRKGQVIVCEQEGANWLEFKDFRKMRSLKTCHSKEVIYVSPSINKYSESRNILQI